MPESYPQSGAASFLPITIPSLSDTANVQDAFKSFYYNDFDPTDINNTTADLKSTTNSVASYLRQLFDVKANYTDKLSVFASTSSAEFYGVLSDKTGTGLAVFQTSPTLITPTLGVALATSINGTVIPTSKTLVTTADTTTVTNTMLAGSITNEKLLNSTISGVALGATLNALSAGTGITLSGGYNGSSAKTVAVDSTVIRTTTTASSGQVITFDGANIVWKAVSELPGTIENATNAVYATSAGSATTATTATNAINTGITNDAATSSSVYPTWVTANTGNLPTKTTSTKLSFVPSTGILSATGFSGLFGGLTLTAVTTGFTAAGGTSASKTLTVSESIVLTSTDSVNSRTLNIGLGGTLGSAAFTPSTDYIASSVSKTGTGNLVYATSPTLVTPILGVATATSINQTVIPTNKTLVATDTSSTIAASTTGNAASATVATKGARSGASSYQQVFVSQADPATYATPAAGDIWMW
jgi:hypothetical protein